MCPPRRRLSSWRARESLRRGGCGEHGVAGAGAAVVCLFDCVRAHSLWGVPARAHCRTVLPAALHPRPPPLATSYQPGARPPAPRRNFQQHWQYACEGEWRKAFLMFSAGEAGSPAGAAAAARPHAPHGARRPPDLLAAASPPGLHLLHPLQPPPTKHPPPPPAPQACPSSLPT